MRSRSSAALVTALSLTTLLGAAPAYAETTTPSPTPSPVITPDTSGCPNRFAPPAPIDLSEVPAPNAPAPAPLPLPERPVGGQRMGECGIILPPGAAALPDGITATSWLVADAGSGEVLAAKDPHGRQRPASTIKLLTALLAADQLPVDKVVTATQADADQEGSRVGLGPGGQYTVRQLLTGLLLVSGNDAAHALAEQLGGVPATIQKMNELASKLGALDTHAATPSGLDGPGMSTSAYDLTLVFGHVLSRPLLAALVGTSQADFPGYPGRPGFVVSNDNKLLGHYPGVLGGKNGFTDDARHTFVAGAVHDGRPLIVVLMRGEQYPVPMWQQAARLLDYGFALPRGHPVGQLVTGAQPTPTTTRSIPTNSSRPSSAAQASLPSSGLIPGLIWLGLAVLVLTLLVILVLRQRRRPHP